MVATHISCEIHQPTTVKSLLISTGILVVWLSWDRGVADWLGEVGEPRVQNEKFGVEKSDSTR